MADSSTTRALILMREAIALLDQGNAAVAACYLQMAIDEADKLQEPRDEPSPQ